jgi:uncharacterized membrane protein
MNANWTSGKAVRIALFVSLALNVALASAIGVHLYRGYNGAEAARPQNFGIERMARRLPAEDAEVLRRIYAARADEIKASQTELRDARRGVRQALETEPFSAEAMNAAVSKMDSERTELMKTLQGVFISAASEMSAEGRVKLAQGPRGPRQANGNAPRERNR